ncbi:MAG TPA: efflux RND transporter permease subunit [Candidatus Eisenbacteria bacterium]|nr:efflux RND transporter permease subunit [Candidatus Eisenbacteria bacterium]
MINSIVRGSLRFRPLVIAAAVIVMAIGINSLDDMPVDVFPEIMPVTVNVQTEALGLSAAEVEQLITVPIEADLLTGTPWVETMRSESVPGLSSIELVFEPGTDPMNARQVVQERLTQAHALPNVSRPPQMLQPLSATNRIMLIGLSSKNQSLIEMSVLARWTIRPRLMGVPGVANVAIWGQRERQLQVQVDPQKIAARNISLVQVVRTAGNALWYSPLSFLEASVAGTGGFIETPNQRIGVRHVLPINTAVDLAKVPVEDTSIPLGEVASVVEDHQPLIGDAMNSGGPGLLLVVEKLPGVNTLEVTDHIVEALTALKPGLGGVEFDTSVYHPANYIRASIRNLQGALLIGLILLVVMLLALTYDWRAALVGLITIPVALMTAVLVMYKSGVSMNVMVLAGLAAALAIVVDDAIVYADSVLRRLRKGPGTNVVRTFLEGLAEVRRPLLFATAVALLAAVPVLFMAGIPGAFVRPMAMAYVAAVLSSFLAACTLTPALCIMFFGKAELVRHDSALSAWIKRMFDSASPGFGKAALAFTVIAAVAGIVLAPRMQVSPAPRFKEPDLLVHWDAVPGTSRGEMNRMLERVGREIRSVPGVRSVGSHVGRAILSDQVVGMASSEMWVNLEPNARYDATVSAVEEIVSGYPGVDADVMTFLSSRFGERLSRVDEPIVVRLYGQEASVLAQQADKVRDLLKAVAGVTDARVDAEAQEPVVEIEVKLDEAAKAGLKPGDVRRAAATLLAGIEVGNLFEEQKIFEVVVWGKPEIRHSISSIQNLLVDTPNGAHVRLGDVAKVTMTPAPNVIRRENVARSVDVVANVNGRSVDAIAADVQARLKGAAFPLEYRAELLGDFAKQEATRMRVLIAAFFVAIGILFVLQAAFGSWGLAFTTLLTLPIAMAGGVLAAVASGVPMSLGATAGFMTVLGLAVRQAVLLVHRYRELRRQEGLEFGSEMIHRGTREHAATTIASAAVTAAVVLPLAIFGSRAGHEVLGPLAIVIMGGLVTTTLYTLSVVPALYARFGAGAMPDAVETEDLGVAV